MSLLSAFQENMAALCPPEAALIVGVSGGADSMCLIDLLYRFHQGRLCCAHVHHGIRGEAADGDAQVVKAYCEERNIPFLYCQADVPRLAREQGMTAEQAGRQVRYDFFRQCLLEQHAAYIAVAHHREDQAETVLLNLLRGSGTRGLGAMEPLSGQILRPLLDQPKEALVNYCRQENIPFCEDETNGDETYTRNALRHRLLPHMREFNPNIIEVLNRTAYLLRRDDAALCQLARKALKGQMQITPCELTLNCAALTAQPEAIVSRMLRLALADFGFSQDIEQRHIEDILSLAAAGNGARLSLPHGLTVWKAYEELIFRRCREQMVTPLPLQEGSFPFAGGTLTAGFARKGEEGEAQHWLDRAAVPENALFRLPEEGDYIRPLGMEGKKMLNDYLSDKKVPRPHRLRPVLACGSEIYWVQGLGISHTARVTENTTEIITLTYNEEEPHHG